MTYLKTTLAVFMLISVQTQASEIRASKMVDKGHRTAIKKDLKNLENFSFKRQPEKKTLKVMGFDDLSSKVAKRWLERRVQWIIKNISSEKLGKRMSLNQRNWEYPLPNTFPIIEKPEKRKGPMALVKRRKNNDDSDEDKAVTAMSNIGTALYFYGKKKQNLYNFKVPVEMTNETKGKSLARSFSYQQVPLSSPRAGLIKIGEGLFMERFQANSEDRDALSNSIYRLGTFFHEARHSDGHGKNLGFFHALCPEDHDLAGLNACDRTLNGSYAVGAQMTKEMLKNCQECSRSEKMKLTLRYFDSLNRIIKVTKREVKNVDQKIQRVNTLIKNKEMLLDSDSITQEVREETKNQLAKLQKARKKLKKAKEQGYIEIPSTFADAAPEGERL